MMPTRKHAAHRDTDEQGAANATPSEQAEGTTDPVAQVEGATEEATQPQSQGATHAASLDDIQVPWRKETATGKTQATAEPAMAGAEAATAAEEAVDWEAR